VLCVQQGYLRVLQRGHPRPFFSSLPGLQATHTHGNMLQCVCVRGGRGVKGFLHPLWVCRLLIHMAVCVAAWCLVVEWFASVVQGGTLNAYVRGDGGVPASFQPESACCSYIWQRSRLML